MEFLLILALAVVVAAYIISEEVMRNKEDGDGPNVPPNL